MLDMVCPDCNVPIMRSREKEEVCCVCGDEYMEKSKPADQKETPKAPAVANKPQPKKPVGNPRHRGF